MGQTEAPRMMIEEYGYDDFIVPYMVQPEIPGKCHLKGNDFCTLLFISKAIPC